MYYLNSLVYGVYCIKLYTNAGNNNILRIKVLNSIVLKISKLNIVWDIVQYGYFLTYSK